MALRRCCGGRQRDCERNRATLRRRRSSAQGRTICAQPYAITISSAFTLRCVVKPLKRGRDKPITSSRVDVHARGIEHVIMPPLTYANYLDLEKLLTLQRPRSTP